MSWFSDLNILIDIFFISLLVSHCGQFDSWTHCGQFLLRTVRLVLTSTSLLLLVLFACWVYYIWAVAVILSIIVRPNLCLQLCYIVLLIVFFPLFKLAIAGLKPGWETVRGRKTLDLMRDRSTSKIFSHSWCWTVCIYFSILLVCLDKGNPVGTLTSKLYHWATFVDVFQLSISCCFYNFKPFYPEVK